MVGDFDDFSASTDFLRPGDAPEVGAGCLGALRHEVTSELEPVGPWDLSPQALPVPAAARRETPDEDYRATWTFDILVFSLAG